MAHPAVILTEADVENLMQGILDSPVPADGSTQDSRIVVTAKQTACEWAMEWIVCLG